MAKTLAEKIKELERCPVPDERLAGPTFRPGKSGRDHDSDQWRERNKRDTDAAQGKKAPRS